MGRNIYEIADDYIAVIAEIEDNEGELTEDLEKRLQITED